MRVALVFVPQWTAAQPHFAIASLAGHLERAGHEVSVHDLNVELMDWILGGDALRLTGRRLASALELLPLELGLRLGTHDGSDRAGVASLRLGAIERWVAGSSGRFESTLRSASAARAALRDSRYYDPSTYVAAMSAIDDALELFSLPFHPSELSWNFFAHPDTPFDLEPLTRLADSRTDNPFRSFFERRIPAILDDDPDLVALSINAFSQVVPGLTLAAMLRDAIGSARAPHVVLGGNFFTRLRDRLVERPAFFERFADSVAIGEGERPLLALAEALDPAWPSGQAPSIDAVPSLLYLDRTSKSVHATRPAGPIPLDAQAFQSIAAFPNDRYLSPDRVLCVRASKGCYWGHCTFCDAHYGLEPDVMEVDRFVAELAHLVEHFGVRDFELVDQCIAPEYLEKMSDAIIAAGLDVRWFFNARTEPGFTPRVLEKARRAGATMIMWGVESGSARLLKLMKKGVSAEGRLDVLRASADAGLFNFAYVFFGFPTETRAEADETIELVAKHTDLIHAYGRSVFSLGKHSPLMRDAERYGILRWVEDTEALSTNVHFELASGLTGDALARVLEDCKARCREAYGDPLWMALRTREALHLYLARRGRDFVTRRGLRETEAPSEAAFVF